MSVTLDVVLTVYPTNGDDVRHILDHNFDSNRGVDQHFRQLDSRSAGGSKYASWDVFQACFNYVSPEEVEEWFRDFTKTHPELHVVLVMDRGDYERDPLVLVTEDMEAR